MVPAAGRTGLPPRASTCPCWAGLPSPWSRESRAPSRHPHPFHPAQAGATEPQGDAALLLSVVGCPSQVHPIPTPGQQRRRDPHDRKKSPGGAPPRAPAPGLPLAPRGRPKHPWAELHGSEATRRRRVNGSLSQSPLEPGRGRAGLHARLRFLCARDFKSGKSRGPERKEGTSQEVWGRPLPAVLHF